VQEGHLAAYAVRVDRSLPETLARIWAFPAAATWTVLEMTGDPNRPTIAAGCALLTVDRPNGREVPDGLKPHAGDHGPALIALSPASTTPLGGSRHAGVHLDELRWPAGGFEDADRRPHLPQVAASG
jgi:type VII secretion protein EccE